MTKERKILLNYLLKQYKQSLKQDEATYNSFKKDALQSAETIFKAFAKRLTKQLSFLQKFGFTCNVNAKPKEYRFEIKLPSKELAKQFGVEPKSNHQVLDIQFVLNYLKQHYFKVGKARQYNGIDVQFEFPGIRTGGGWDLQVIDEKTLKQMKEQMQRHMKNSIWSIITRVQKNYKQLQNLKK